MCHAKIQKDVAGVGGVAGVAKGQAMINLSV